MEDHANVSPLKADCAELMTSDEIHESEEDAASRRRAIRFAATLKAAAQDQADSIMADAITEANAIRDSALRAAVVRDDAIRDNAIREIAAREDVARKAAAREATEAAEAAHHCQMYIAIKDRKEELYLQWCETTIIAWVCYHIAEVGAPMAYEGTVDFNAKRKQIKSEFDLLHPDVDILPVEQSDIDQLVMHTWSGLMNKLPTANQKPTPHAPPFLVIQEQVADRVTAEMNKRETTVDSSDLCDETLDDE